MVRVDMLDFVKHIVNKKSGRFAPDKFEHQYETRWSRTAPGAGIAPECRLRGPVLIRS